MLIFTRHRGNFAQCLKKVANARPTQTYASIAQYIDERMKQGADADVSKEGAWGPASFNEVSGDILATRAKFNPLLAYPEQAMEAMKKGEFYLTDDILFGNKPASQILAKIAEADEKKFKKQYWRRGVLNLGKIVTHDVPTDCFADDKGIVFLSEGERRAEKYGLWLRNLKTNNFPSGIASVKVYHQDLTGKDKSRGFWLGGRAVGCRSDFSCYVRGLCDGGASLFGVNESAEGTPQKILRRGVITPTVARIYRYAKPYISPKDIAEFRKGLADLFKKQ